MDDEEKVCEKCGGEVGSRMVGDEIYDRCVDCGWITH
jgi:tRNA(Ile2) C34 agmatinyltransferase TiaS